MLDLCKRCGTDVCAYVRPCFDLADTFALVGGNTTLEHVFYNGGKWHGTPERDGEEVS